MGIGKKYNFTEEQMEEARKMRAEGATYQQIADKFGGSPPMWHGRLDPKSKEKSRAYYERNRETRIAKAKERYHANPDAKRIRDRMRKYGLTEEQANAMLEVPNCGICGVELTNDTSKTARCIDHCHDTQEVRGVLCNCCNRALGLFGDSVENLSAAILYLGKTTHTR